MDDWEVLAAANKGENYWRSEMECWSWGWVEDRNEIFLGGKMGRKQAWGKSHNGLWFGDCYQLRERIQKEEQMVKKSLSWVSDLLSLMDLWGCWLEMTSKCGATEGRMVDMPWSSARCSGSSTAKKARPPPLRYSRSLQEGSLPREHSTKGNWLCVVESEEVQRAREFWVGP